MSKEKITMVKIKDSYRLMIKSQAHSRGMGMQEYLEFIIDRDKRDIENIKGEIR